MRNFCLCLWLLSIVGSAYSQNIPSARPKLEQEQIKKAIQDLSSPRFAVREKASKLLWEGGREAESLLREVVKNGDEETINRVKVILDKLDWGIYPDTHPDVLKLIERFRGGNHRERMVVLSELTRFKPYHFSTVRKLIQREPLAEIRQEMCLTLARDSRAIIPKMIVEGQLAEASELIEVCITPGNIDALGDFAALAFLRKQISPTIARLEKELPNEKGENRQVTLEKIAYLHRASKNWASAIKAAKEADNKLLVSEIYWESSDWIALSKIPIEEIEIGEDRVGLSAAYARKAGDRVKYDSLIEQMRKDLNGVNTNDLTAKNIAKSLLLNGEGAEAIKILKEKPGSASAFVFDLLCAQLKFKEAFEHASQALKTLENEEGTDEARMELNFRRVLALCNLGEKESATQICRKQFEIFHANPDLGEIVLRASRDLIRANHRELAIECIAQFTKQIGGEGAIERSPFESDLPLKFFFEDYDNVPMYWLKAMVGNNKELNHTVLIAKIEKLLTGNGPPEEFAKLEKALKERIASVVPRRNGNNIDFAYALAELYRLHRNYKQAETAYQEAIKMREAAGPVRKTDPLSSAPPDFDPFGGESVKKTLYSKYAEVLSKLNKHAESAKYYEKAWLEDPSDPLQVFMQGQEIILSGDRKKGESLIDLSHWVSLGDDTVRTTFAEELGKRGFSEDSLREMQFVLEVGWFRTFHVGNVHLKMAKKMARKRNFVKAAEYYEKDVISLFRTGATFQDPRAFLTVPELAKTFRLRAMVAAGKAGDALKEAKQSLELLPGNVDLAIDFVPELDKAGRKAEAEEMYRLVKVTYDSAIQSFSNSADLKNSLAWMMVNCNRDLTEAKKLAEMAVKLRPSAAGYLDTLAEVHFRLKDRTKALELMKKCAELEPKNPYYRKQLERFEKRPFDSPLPDEETGED